MTGDYGARKLLDSRLELYLSLDADPLHKELFGEPPDDEMYPTAVGLQQVRRFRTGIQTIEEEKTPLNLRSMSEPGYEETGFCWENDVVNPVQVAENWFKRESLYEEDERGHCMVHTYDAPLDLMLTDTRGATLMMDYTTNTKTAENLAFRTTIVYGVPWIPASEQHCAVSVVTDHLPETVHECLSTIELAFREDPVRDIPICLFDDFGGHDEQSVGYNDRWGTGTEA